MPEASYTRDVHYNPPINSPDKAAKIPSLDERLVYIRKQLYDCENIICAMVDKLYGPSPSTAATKADEPIGIDNRVRDLTITVERLNKALQEVELFL